MSAAFGVILFTILCHGGVILPGWAEMEVGERVTVGVVFINSGFQKHAKSLTSLNAKFWIFSYTQKIEPGEDKEWTRGGGSRER